MAQNKKLTKEEIQEDKFINLVLLCYGFLKDNVRSICITLAVGIVVIAGYLIIKQNQETTHAEASANFNAAIEISKEAETNFLDTTVKDENENENDSENTEETEKASFQDSEEKLKDFFEKYPNVTFADKARFNYAKNLYFQGKYKEARTEFEKVLETHRPENEIYALYAQKAVGNCYEQQGDYDNAISAYEERQFPKTSQVPPEIRQYVITNAKFNQALCYEKKNALEDAKAAYQDIIDQFKQTLEIAIQKESQDLIKEAKEVLTVIEEPINPPKAEQLESEQLYYQALVDFTDTIRTYKVLKDVKGGLPKEVRKRIRSFEDMTTTFITSIKSARKNEKTGSQSTALSYYNQVIKFEKFGLNRDLYERALLNYNRLTMPGTGISNEE